MKPLIRLLVTGLLLVTAIKSNCQDRGINLADTAGIRAAAELIGLNFTGEEIVQMGRNTAQNRSSYSIIRDFMVDNAVAPAFAFNPLPNGLIVPPSNPPVEWALPDFVEIPENEHDIAFLSIPELAYLIKNKMISSVELTRIYLNRLKNFNDSLLCVVTLTEELAMNTAMQLDKELSEGIYRGPLHGIPYGVKDLMAVEGYPTTWGAMPYKDQELNMTAAVVKKLEEAGAVLVAKLTCGALAMGDVWYGGTTRNPWNIREGSSGSSAGPASATAAGLVAFAIGTETLGSIVSPSSRCGVTGLRPSFGRVSRYGTMALSWTMDKIGPICRNAVDCAIVFDYLRGGDELDSSTIDAGFDYPADIDPGTLRIGYLEDLFDKDYSYHENDSITLELFRSLGASLVPVTLPEDFPAGALRIILSAEAAAAFDQLTLTDRDSLLVSQENWSWPNTFRSSRLIPAVEYIQANRIRTLLIEQMEGIMKEFDLIIAPSRGGNQLTLTNLTGHPSLLLPNGFLENSSPTSIILIGPLFSEGLLCAFGELYQENAGHHKTRPPLFNKNSF